MEVEVAAATPGWLRVARMLFGVHDDERAWRRGAEGEEAVGRKLAKLGDGWTVLHDLPLNAKGSNLDHLVIGPGGVFALNTKKVRGKIWVGERMVMINGQRTSYLRTARWEARTVASLLSTATGQTVDVRSALVFVGGDLTIKQRPADVGVTTNWTIKRRLESHGTVLDPERLAGLQRSARLARTWPAPPLPKHW